MGGSIRNFGVGLIAIAAFAAAGMLFRRRPRGTDRLAATRSAIDSLYAAGL